MAKPKTPLLSFQAQGTIAKSVTFQQVGSQSRARTKPTPTDAKTLIQLYQRWDYYHYCVWWDTLTAAQKEVYLREPDRGRMGGFSYWMKTRLLTLPDLLLRVYLDEHVGSIAHDSSKGNHNGTLTGALWKPGKLSQCLYFDGVDDRVNFGTSLDLAPKTSFTLEILINPSRYVYGYFAGRGWRYPWGVTLEATRMRLDTTDTLAALHTYYFNALPPLGKWSYFMVSYDNPNHVIRWKLNGSELSTNTTTYSLQQGVNYPTWLGSNPQAPTLQPYKGYLDHFSLENRPMSFTEARERYERMWTLQ